MGAEAARDSSVFGVVDRRRPICYTLPSLIFSSSSSNITTIINL